MKRKYILLGIILLSAFLRLWQLGNVPPSPDWDEAALGYNAYSIRETGKDEYGEPMPIILRSFDDYKPALYVYFVIPFISMFGLNIFAVRLVSALFGIGTVIATYFLVKELLGEKIKYQISNIKNTYQNSKNSLENGRLKMENAIPLLSAGLLAISPWHIQFSRIAFESNVGLALNVFSVLFFIKGLKKPLFLVLYAVCAGLSLYVYQSEKVFVPLLFILLVFVFRNELLKLSKKYLILPIIVGIVISLPIASYTLTNEEALTRAQGVSVFSSDNQYLNDLAERNLINRERGDVVGLIFDNRRVWYAKNIISNYLSHYNIYWLFLSGDENRHHAPEVGLLYLWEFPFLFLGIYSLIFGKWDRRLKLLVFGLFLLAPVPAAVTTGVPHAVRTLNFLPTFQVFTAIGIISVFAWIMRSRFTLRARPSSDGRVEKFFQPVVLDFGMHRLVHPFARTIKWFLVIFSFSIFTLNFIYYINQYFVQQNYFYSQAWQYGYKEAVDEVKKISGSFEKIVVSNKPHLDQSYIFFLFYLEYPPALYQKESVGASGGFRENHFFGNYEFRPIEWSSEEKTNTLFVGRPDDFPKDIKTIKTINFLDGEPAILIVEG